MVSVKDGLEKQDYVQEVSLVGCCKTSGLHLEENGDKEKKMDSRNIRRQN